MSEIAKRQRKQPKICKLMELFYHFSRVPYPVSVLLTALRFLSAARESFFPGILTKEINADVLLLYSGAHGFSSSLTRWSQVCIKFGRTKKPDND